MVESRSISTDDEFASHIQLSQQQSEIASLTSLEVNNTYLDLELELQAKDEALKVAETKLEKQMETCKVQLAEAAQRVEQQKQKLSVVYQRTVELQLSVENKEVILISPACLTRVRTYLFLEWLRRCNQKFAYRRDCQSTEPSPRFQCEMRN